MQLLISADVYTVEQKGERGRGREGEEVCVCCATRDSELPLNVSIIASL